MTLATKHRTRTIAPLSRFALIALLLAGLLGTWGCSQPNSSPAPSEPGRVNEPAKAEATAIDTAAQDSLPRPPWSRDANKTFVEQLGQGHLRKYGDDPDVLVLPGLVANRKEQWVRVWGEATGLSVNVPAEFFVIGEQSGQAYESVAVSFARPSDVHRALVFIGLPPGRPADYSKGRYWPKGERAFMSFEWEEADAASTQKGESTKQRLPPARRRARAEALQIDTRTGQPLSSEGFVFVGSFWFESEEEPGKELYAADVYGPHCIASNYNTPTTVLDVSRRAGQSEVYGRHELNPAFQLARHQPLELVLEPEFKDGKRRVKNLLLYAEPKPGTEGAQLQDLRLKLHDERDQSLADNDDLAHVLAAFATLVEAGHDPYVTVHLADEIHLRAVRQLYTVLAGVEGDEGIRLESSPEGQLDYRAFLREEPIGEDGPTRWELYLTAQDATISGMLRRLAGSYGSFSNADQPEREIAEEEAFAVATPAALAQAMGRAGQEYRIVSVFAPPNIAYRDVATFLEPLVNMNGEVYVFLTEAPNPVPSRTSPAP